MQEHHREKTTGYDVVVSKGFTALKPLAFTAPADETVEDFRGAVADKSKIAKMIFGGFELTMTKRVLAAELGTVSKSFSP